MTTPDDLVLPLDAIGTDDLPQVGGKGANLGELVRIGLPVPPGFCVTASAFEEFVDACPGIDDLYEALDDVPADDVAAARDAGRRVREALLDVPVPADVARAVGLAWRALGADAAYAVRSSATAEDLPGASFAGQQDTYLNVRGEAALLDAVRRCWASLFTDRAIQYRARNDFGHRQVQLSVVVQTMVMADVSGVLFTADPVTGHRRTLAIDATFGLGEALVSGQVTPDAYRVDKAERRILDRQIADKEMAIYPLEHGGTRKETLPESKRSAPTLTDAQVLELAELGIRAESHYGSPQDLEWAVADGDVYVLQARPITSLFPIDGLQWPDDRLHVYFSMGHQQNMTKAMTPLGLSCVRSLVAVGLTQEKVESPYLRAAGGRLFFDLTTPLSHRLPRRAVMEVVSQFDALAPASLRAATQRPEFGAAASGGLRWSVVRGVVPLVARVLATVWWRAPLSVATVDDLVERHVAAVQRTLERSAAGEAKVRATVDVLHGLYKVVLLWAPQFAAGVIAHRLLVRLGRDWADPDDLTAYTLGLPGNAVTEMTLALGDLADEARRSPRVVAHVGRLAEDSWAWLAEAAEIEDSGPFLDAWQRFLDRYGCRGAAEVDIGSARWYEEPLPLLRMVAGYLDDEPGKHRKQQESLERARETAVASLVAGAAHGVGGAARSRLVQRMIMVSQAGGVLREHHKYLAMQVLRRVKDGLRETALLLSESGQLAEPDDVWFLTLPELLGLTRGDRLEAVDEVPHRRTDLPRLDAISPPLVLTSDGETPLVSYEVADAPPGALLGQPVSGGVAEGRVRVVADPRTEALHPGEILVAAFTDPGWTPLFTSAGGLVTEVGGLLTHGSVVAREYGIPAVVGVRGATGLLRTGQRVRVDGGRGFVEILDGAEE